MDAKNLIIESQQDTETYQGKQQNASAQVTVGYGFSASGDYSRSKINADHASVSEQSGIFAGDDGYQINIKEHTDLKGGIITSTQSAEDKGKNQFSTGTLTANDLHNHSHYDGESFGLGGGIEINGGWNGKTVDKQGNPTDSVNSSVGYGNDSDNQESVTRSGINTRNIQITDEAKQQQQTGKSAAETIAQIHTHTTTETAAERSGSLKNSFDKDKVQSELDLQRTVSQDFSKNVQQANTEINQHLDKLKADKEAAEKAAVEALANGDMATAERKIKEAQTAAEKADNWQRGKVILNMIASGLTAPTQSGAGIAAATASPAVSYAIGQHFKDLASQNANGELTASQETAHVLAHAVLGAAVSAAGGNDALAGALSAGGAEAAAPVISGWLYGEKDGSKLTAEQKETVVAITGLLGTATGATVGSTTANAVAGSLNAQGAMNNALSDKEIINEGKRIDALCAKSTNPDICRNNEIAKIVPFSDAKSNLTNTEIQNIAAVQNQAFQEISNICNNNAECLNNAGKQFTYARLHCDTTACMVEQSNIIIRAVSLKYGSIWDTGKRLFDDFSPVLPAISMVGKAATVKPNGIVELFTDSRGVTIKGAVGVGPTDAMAIAKDARAMPNIPTGSQARVIANNPYIPSGNFTIMDYLPEAARITKKGGEIVINGTTSNKYLRGIPSEAELEKMGLGLKYNGPLKSEFRGMDFRLSSGKPIKPSDMKTIIFEKIK